MIVVEDLNVKGMMQNGKLSRHIADVGWGEFRRLLEYKTKWYGSVLAVAPRFLASSKQCSSCGYVASELPLRIRKWQCPECKVVNDRDKNAATNLKNWYTESSSEIDACGDRATGAVGNCC